MSNFVSEAASNFLQNAFKKAKRQGLVVTTGPCGTYDECGKHFTEQGHAVKLSKTKRICPVCAVLMTEKLPTSLETQDALLETRVADILGVTTEWVVSYLQGFDGDESCASGELEAFKIGRRMASRWIEE